MPEFKLWMSHQTQIPIEADHTERCKNCIERVIHPSNT